METEIVTSPEVVSTGVEWGLTVYQMLASVITAGLAWVGVKVSALIKNKIKNEMVGGMLARLNDSAFEAVKAVNEQMKDLIGKAKDPASPGGVKITIDEAAKLREAALEHVKSYWGPKGLKELAYVLGFGSMLGFKTDSEGLEKMIGNKIEAAVNEVKATAANPQPPTTS